VVIIPRSVNASNAMYLQNAMSCKSVDISVRHSFYRNPWGGISHILSRMKYYVRVDTACAPLRVSAAAAAFYARAVTLG